MGARGRGRSMVPAAAGVTLRDLRRDDGDLLDALMAGLSPRSLPENTPARALFRALFPVCLTRRDDDALVLVAVLDGGIDDWTITMDDVLADLAP